MEDAKIKAWPEDSSIANRRWLKNKNGKSSYRAPGYTDNSGDVDAAAAALREGEMDEEAFREGVVLPQVDFVGGADPTYVSSLWFDTPTMNMSDHSGIKAGNRGLHVKLFNRATIIVTLLMHFAEKLAQRRPV
jgi:hypothetical protein